MTKISNFKTERFFYGTRFWDEIFSIFSKLLILFRFVFFEISVFFDCFAL